LKTRSGSLQSPHNPLKSYLGNLPPFADFPNNINEFSWFWEPQAAGSNPVAPTSAPSTGLIPRATIRRDSD
jgi:hypothetical protein